MTFLIQRAAFKTLEKCTLEQLYDDEAIQRLPFVRLFLITGGNFDTIYNRCSSLIRQRFKEKPLQNTSVSPTEKGGRWCQIHPRKTSHLNRDTLIEILEKLSSSP